MRALTAMGLAAACGAGCGGGVDYEVWIAFESPNLASDAAVVLVWLEETCPDDLSLTMPPAASVRSTVVVRDARVPRLGDVPEGEYAVHAIARNARCRVVAAGCQAVTLDGDGRIDLTLIEQGQPNGCTNSEVCAVGECLAEGTCAPEGEACTPELACCTGTCSPEILFCVPVGG